MNAHTKQTAPVAPLHAVVIIANRHPRLARGRCPEDALSDGVLVDAACGLELRLGVDLQTLSRMLVPYVAVNRMAVREPSGHWTHWPNTLRGCRDARRYYEYRVAREYRAVLGWPEEVLL